MASTERSLCSKKQRLYRLYSQVSFALLIKRSLLFHRHLRARNATVVTSAPYASLRHGIYLRY